MPSYLVTGVSRGIGFEFLRQLSADSNNLVVGLVRDKETTEKKVAAELGNRPNIHIAQADITNVESFKRSYDVVSPIVNGSLDYIIANAGLVPDWSGFDSVSDSFNKDPKRYEDELLECYKVNVIGNIFLFNVYLPLVKNGSTKKVITITSGLGDQDMTREYKFKQAAPYCLSKTAMNMATLKFHAEYADEGIMFLNICPGSVDVGKHSDNLSEEDMKGLQELGAALSSYSSSFKGNATPEHSVGMMIPLMKKASLADGYGGAYISHKGRGEKYL